jgi:hypothetical protein
MVEMWQQAHRNIASTVQLNKPNGHDCPPSHLLTLLTAHLKTCCGVLPNSYMSSLSMYM